MKKDISREHARNILADEKYNAYGPIRLYGVTEDGRSIVAIKSVQNLDRWTFSSIYMLFRSN